MSYSESNSVFKESENKLEHHLENMKENITNKLEKNEEETESASEKADGLCKTNDETVTEENLEAVQKEPSTNKKEKKPKKKHKRMNPWLSLLIKVVIIALVIFIGSFFVQFKSVHDNSMFPSLRDGDLVITTNLLSYSYNDILLYKVTLPNGKEEKHFGRVICLEDNCLEIDDYGNVRVNGSIVESHNYYEQYNTGSLVYPYQVKNGIFVLQDYRVEINDSRTYGSIPRENIIGKVIFVFRIRGF